MIPTSFIPTTTVAVTVTDYTISGTGLVTLAANLANGATLTWTGGYYRRVRFDMDDLDMERIFGATAAGGGQTWEGKTVKLISVK